MSPNDRLDSWKEIAAYLKRDVTTVRRWEKREGLPVHRHVHERRDSVYAYTSEIEEWWQGRRNHLAENGADVHPPAPAQSLWTRGRLAWAVAAILMALSIALAGFLAVRAGRTTDANNEVRFALHPPPDTSFGSVALSPDGRQIAFTAVPDVTAQGKTLLWVRPVGALDARSLPDTEDATFPFWSPASDALGFFAGGKLWTIDLAGGAARPVADAPSGRGGTWNRDGIILFARDRDSALFRVPATGGSPTAVTGVERPNERGHTWPEFLPDGHHFLYLADSNFPEHHNLFVGSLDSTDRKLLIPRASSNATYTADGYLFFAHDRALMAQRFDTESLSLTGEPVTVVDRVNEQMGFDHKKDFSVSQNGVAVYREMQSPASRLVWRDRVHPLSPMLDTPAEYYSPTFAPDDTRVALSLFDPKPSKRFGYGLANVRGDVWIADRSTGALSQFTADPAAEWGPVWSPDGRTIVFSSDRNGTLGLVRKDAFDAGAAEVPLETIGGNPVAQSWSPDGKFILYAAFDQKTRADLWLLPMSGDRTPVPLVQTEFGEEQSQISPDGRWFAYTSHESGQPEVYVQSFPKPAHRWRVSTHGGADARWRRDGKELFYISNDRQLMAVSVRLGVMFEHGPAVALFDAGVQPFWYEARNLYDVSRDGRFLFMAPIEDDRSSPFTVIVHWNALKKVH